MKKLLILITAIIMATIPAKAMDYEEARQRAWFLTDKMAYELNLTPEQYDRAYQINLDYLLSIRTASDCYGNYWAYRNTDLSCVLFDWQYTLYTTLDYFFRPIRWVRSSWYFPIFSHYRRGYYYFDRPTVYISYHGMGWHRRGHNDVSPYLGVHFRPGNGMRDRYHGHTGSRPGGPSNFGRPGNDRPSRPHFSGQPGSSKPGNGNHPGNNSGNSKPGTGRPETGNRPNRNFQGSGNGGRNTSTIRPSQNGNRNGNSRSGKSATPSSSKTSRTSRSFGR